jgi:hypothetical protein
MRALPSCKTVNPSGGARVFSSALLPDAMLSWVSSGVWCRCRMCRRWMCAKTLLLLLLPDATKDLVTNEKFAAAAM